jgi:endoglucanase
VAPRKMSDAPLALSIVVSFGEQDSPDLLQRTLQAIVAQEGRGEKFFARVSVWFCGGPSAIIKELSRESSMRAVKVVESSASFLCDLPRSLELLEGQMTATGSYVVIVRCGVFLKPRCLAFLLDEIDSDETAVCTANGFRLFPHDRLSSPLTELKKRVHFEFYSESRPDRAVHVFTPDFCCLGRPVLKNIAEKHHQHFDVSSFPHIWCSFVITCHLGLPIWKMKMREHLDISALPPLSSSLVDNTVSDSVAFDKFYQMSYDSDWPKGVAVVHYDREKLDSCLANRESCDDIWAREFAGVNMLSEPASRLDFRAAVSCGVRVIRVGAVGGAEDLMYLVDPRSTSETQDRAHLLKVLPRLRRSLTEIGSHGLKAIVTIVDMPGCPFFSMPDDAPMLFWERKELRLRATKLWGLIAQNLVDLRHLIMGYDLINEPFNPEDREISFVEETPVSHVDTLNNFYSDTVDEIRLYDRDTAIIINPSRYAMPTAMNTLKPISDPYIKYGVHCYYPPPLTLRRNTSLKYPGIVPVFSNCDYPEKVTVDRDSLRRIFVDNVVSWQEKHNVPSHQILVAEFGICREIPGAQEYLKDLVEIFSEFGWSWLLFSFRDEEWDALDYELGPHKANMLDRSNCDMFKSIAAHFR